MTLKSRNRFTLASAFLFLGISACILLYLVLNLRNFNPGAFSFVKPNHWSVFLGEICIVIYIPLAAFYLYAHFEKTPATETGYFVLFLLGCVPELFRLFVPFEAAAGTYPQFLIIIGRALFWGRMLCVISLFMLSVSESENKSLRSVSSVHIEQNILIILVFSLAIASLVPVNTARIYANYSVGIGSATDVHALYAVAIMLTFLSYALRAWKEENRE